MEDTAIVDLYWQRSDRAISETDRKYGRYCHSIAFNFVRNNEDAEECVNDTYFALWNALPSQKPSIFSAFIGRITRNLALKKYEYISASKRNPAVVTSFEELSDCVSGTDNVESEVESRQIENMISTFLWRQGEEKRNVFIRRYWYFDSIETICSSTGFSQSKVKSMLYEMRRKLRANLEREGIEL